MGVESSFTHADDNMRAYFLLVALALSSTHAAEPLPALGASRETVTVSGLSSGGFMAVQFHLAHSALVRGIGVIAGGPFECAEATLERALKHCMRPQPDASPPDAHATQARVERRARNGLIDAPENLADDKVWAFSGASDSVVERPVVDALVAFYRLHLSSDAVRYVEHPRAGHAVLSPDADTQACDVTQSPFINFCDGFDAAGEMLAHLLGPLAPRVAPAGRLIAFDQRPFSPTRPLEASLSDTGYAYIPRACSSGECRIHVVFHGCLQSAAQVGTTFVERAGYNQWADNNRLVLLYPQIRPRSGLAWGSTRWLQNPRGCWDWWGYTGAAYATKEAPQIEAVRAMIDRLME